MDMETHWSNGKFYKKTEKYPTQLYPIYRGAGRKVIESAVFGTSVPWFNFNRLY